MAKTTLDMIMGFGGQVEAAAGAEVRQQVMAGVEALPAKPKPERASLWMKAAIDRLDALVEEPTRHQIMERCGEACALINQAVIERGRARRAKAGSEEAFLVNEVLRPATGQRLEREGDVLYQYYTPQNFTRPMRCFCGLMRALPEGVQASPTYCHCSQGFVRTYWEAALGHPVTVEVVESALTGAAECMFKINLHP